ncbi:vacuolar protein sorting-associated protein-like protein vps5 [Lepidopterella palustris CBS 459.81]|uniref:Vacuolar protein sorting-associated protein-like protein vps5 n=1 Tax=Lepidopterella palustris CBS 459.81 TaxID=1314670 RepID=A0A8E2JCR4_9PEZI|nr:vacuolar protein sorting-associated protein-like protein vps5 [Lepidopterella palustris CBS 459.81]
MDLGDEGSSPWGDVPSRSNSSHNLTKASNDDHLQAPDSLESSKTSASTVPNVSAAPRSPAGRGPRRRQYGTQPTRLEAVDDPLGPLGAPTPPSQLDEPPAPPQKELVSARSSRPTTTASTTSIRSLMDSVNLDDDEEETSATGPRIPPPVQPPSNAPPQRQTHPSVSVEQAAKPSFHIIVGDPHKVGDLTSSHTEYSVTTKTTSKGYRNPEFTVSRRYRDFLWLYNQLHSNNPGVVIPPPPEKQAVGRFDADFVESRRAALERMLNKTAAHPILQHDGDLKLFLESDAFNVDVKNKERKDPGLSESKGMLGSIGINVGSGSKFIEHDDWFHDRKIYLDALETQLKALLKATDTVVAQRKGLAEACGDFSASLHSLAAVELSPSLSAPLDGLSDIQIRIRELYERQAQQDVLTLGIVIDEYIRLIGSVKTSFQQRQKAYHSWHSAESELQKRKTTQDKLLRQGRSQQDRLNQLSADVADAERRVHQARLLFEDMGRLMRTELERFEREKVEDFKSGVETFLESAVEAQKELIEIWETYLMQLDAEDGEGFGHAHPPAGVIAASLPGDTKHGDSNERPESQGTDTNVRAAAEAATEMDE